MDQMIDYLPRAVSVKCGGIAVLVVAIDDGMGSLNSDSDAAANATVAAAVAVDDAAAIDLTD
jgi:hypothetical protein